MSSEASPQVLDVLSGVQLVVKQAKDVSVPDDGVRSTAEKVGAMDGRARVRATSSSCAFVACMRACAFAFVVSQLMDAMGGGAYSTAVWNQHELHPNDANEAAIEW